jgi:hypothetical protein
MKLKPRVKAKDMTTRDRKIYKADGRWKVWKGRGALRTPGIH